MSKLDDVASELTYHEKVIETFIDYDLMALDQVIRKVGFSRKLVRHIINGLVRDKVLIVKSPNRYYMNKKLREVFLTARQKNLQSYKEVLEYYKREVGE